jgi:chemotaxis methyl-accepting protein methylase
MYFETITDESDALVSLISPFDKNRFMSAGHRLHTLFDIYANTCPAPIPAPGLIVTPEIRTQCERFLPIADIAAIYNHLYSAALTYPPILSSTPFHNSLSWADTFAALPKQFQFSANPARLLESVLADDRQLTRFLFASFLPSRFYGGIGRYPEQQKFIREWLTTRTGENLHCLDAACGTGEDTYGLALLLSEQGITPEETRIDGWTLEPLEIWAAAHRRFPHDQRREALFREETSTLFEQGFLKSIRFRCVDLTTIPLNSSSPAREEYFDLIICNGLLGGPIINGKEQLERSVCNLANLLAPDGILLAADNFHGGWKQKCPQTMLRALFHNKGLETFEAGEGIGGHMR